MLRQQEEIMLYGHVLYVNEQEAAEVLAFLKHEFQQESLSYPYKVPNFDESSALWAAKLVYIAAQLILYRKDNEADLATLLPNFSEKMTPDALLSADLCLRFLPSMIVQLKLIDPEDKLVDILENHLHNWHYSGVNYPLQIEKCDFNSISENKCVMQLYCNRIIAHKKGTLAKHPFFNDWIQANLGIFPKEFWGNLQV